MGYRDLLGLQTTTLVFSLIEASVAIVAACLASMRRLFVQYCLKSQDNDTPQASRKLSDLQPLTGGDSEVSFKHAVIALNEV